MRRQLSFTCEGAICAATLDDGDGAGAVLLVSGGSEPRSGAHGWQARLAAALAAAGLSVMRFDRRGVGDSDGVDGGFEASAPEIVAAAALLRASCPAHARLVGVGNCDAASALALFGEAAGLAGVILLNPWIAAQDDDLPPAAAIRARYLRRLLDPAAWGRLLSGGIDLRRALRGVARATTRSVTTELAQRMAQALARGALRSEAIVAERDATGLAFAATRPSILMARIDSASHNFVDAGDLERLVAACLAAITRLS